MRRRVALCQRAFSRAAYKLPDRRETVSLFNLRCVAHGRPFQATYGATFLFGHEIRSQVCSTRPSAKWIWWVPKLFMHKYGIHVVQITRVSSIQMGRGVGGSVWKAKAKACAHTSGVFFPLKKRKTSWFGLNSSLSILNKRKIRLV